jgi:cation-transporting ATPase 13A2
VQGLTFLDFQTDTSCYKDCPRESPSTLLMEAMASCTEICFVNGVLVGDPLDVKMFEATNWVLEEPSLAKDENVILATVSPNRKDYQSSIIRRFEFSSQLQRMSVICHNTIDNRYRCFVKGSPEIIKTLCTNVPADFDEVL